VARSTVLRRRLDLIARRERPRSAARAFPTRTRRKLVARNIGFLYYRRHEGDDPHSLLRPPMHGNGDIDELKETL